MFNGVDLSALLGSQPSKYGINLAKTLFNEEELITGIISPQKQTTRQVLPPEKTSLIKSKYYLQFLD